MKRNMQRLLAVFLAIVCVFGMFPYVHAEESVENSEPVADTETTPEVTETQAQEISYGLVYLGNLSEFNDIVEFLNSGASTELLAETGNTMTIVSEHPRYAGDMTFYKYEESPDEGYVMATGPYTDSSLTYFIFADGTIGFCVQPWLAGVTGDYYLADWEGMDLPMQQGVALALAYGAPNNGDTSEDALYATAALVFDMAMGYRKKDGSFSLDYATGSALTSSPFEQALLGYIPTAHDEYTAILAKLAKHGKKPSFTDSTIKLEYNSGTGKYEANVKDENGVLADFNYVSTISGLTFTKDLSTNTLYISATPDAAKNLANGFKVNNRGQNVEIGEEQVLVWKTDQVDPETGRPAQITVSLPATDPMPSGFSIQADVPGTATVKKTSSDGSVEGYALKFYNSTRDDKVVYLRSDANGNFYITDSNYTEKTSGRVYTIPDVWDGNFSFREIPSKSDNSNYTMTSVRVVIKNADGVTTYDKTFSGSDITKDANGEFVITQVPMSGLNGGGSMSIEIHNEPDTVDVTVVKTSPDGNVNGISFTVKNNTTGTTGTYKTADGGKFTFKATPGDSITITETVPAGYTAERQSQTITVNSDASKNTVSFKNTPITGSVQLVKLDEDTKEKLSGATFVLTDSKGVKHTMVETPAGSGVYVATNIPYGSFSVVETAPPPKYEPNSTVYTGSITTNGQRVELKATGYEGIPNDKISGSGTAAKATTGSITKEGYALSITMKRNGLTSSTTTYLKSDSAGKFYVTDSSFKTVTGTKTYTISELYDGTYTIKEWLSKSGYGYAKPQSITIVVKDKGGKETFNKTYTASQLTQSTENGFANYATPSFTVTGLDGGGTMTISVVNEPVTVTTTVTKTSLDGVVDGISFTVKNETTGATGTYKTANGGKFSFQAVVGHKYTITEQVPDNYLCSEPTKTITIKATGNTVSFENIPLGKVMLTKIDEDTKEKLSGATFVLTDSKGVQHTMVETPAGSGVYVATNIPYGSFSVVETAPPPKYEPNSTVYTGSITKGGDVVDLKATGYEGVPNDKISGSGTAAKATTGSITKEGYALSITMKRNGLTSSVTTYLKSDADGKFYVTDSSFKTVTGTKTYTISELYDGTYTIKEWLSKSGYGYAKPQSITIVVKDKDGKETFNKTYTASQLTQSTENGFANYATPSFTVTGLDGGGTMTISVVNEPVTVPAEIVKTADDGKVDGISFTVKNETTGTTETKVTDTSGKIVWQAVVGHKYTITEIVPEGYLCRSANPQSITIEASGNSVKFENYPIRGNIQWNKVDTDTEELLSGATWKVTDSKGNTYEVKEISPGVYRAEGVLYGKATIVEVTPPKGHEKNTTVYSVDIKEHGKDYTIEIDPYEGIPNEPTPGSGTASKTSTNGISAEGYALSIWTDRTGSVAETTYYLKSDADGKFYVTDSSFKTVTGTKTYMVEGLYDGKYVITEWISSSDYIHAYTKAIQIIVTDADGNVTYEQTFSTSMLSTTTVDGITNYSTPEINIKGLSGGGTMEVIVVNHPIPGTATVTKTTTDGEWLDGYAAKLSCSNRDDTTIYLRSDKDGKFYVTDADYSEVTGAKTYTIPDIYDGVFSIRELIGESTWHHEKLDSITITVTDKNGKVTYQKTFTGEELEQKEMDYILSNISLSGLNGGGNLDVQIVNTPLPARLTVNKLNRGNAPLSGAKFLLEWSKDGKTWAAVTANTTDKIVIGGCQTEGLVDGCLITGESGVIEFIGLHPMMQYRLTELEAPDGYVLLADYAYVGTFEEKYEYSLELDVINTAAYELPQSGKLDGLFIVSTGVVMIGVALLLLVEAWLKSTHHAYFASNGKSVGNRKTRRYQK